MNENVKATLRKHINKINCCHEAMRDLIESGDETPVIDNQILHVLDTFKKRIYELDDFVYSLTYKEISNDKK